MIFEIDSTTRKKWPFIDFSRNKGVVINHYVKSLWKAEKPLDSDDLSLLTWTSEHYRARINTRAPVGAYNNNFVHKLWRSDCRTEKDEFTMEV